jgi:acid phosphatase (class A)
MGEKMFTSANLDLSRRRGAAPAGRAALLVALAFLTVAPARAEGPFEDPFLAPGLPAAQSLIAAPPADGSAEQQAELAALHVIEAHRTKVQEQAARADAEEKTVLAFAGVLGAGFSAENAPATFALAAKVAQASEAYVRSAKRQFHRPHPYQADATLHPACKPKKPVADESYPSGHALRGWLLGLTLADLISEKRERILSRAEDYARNRLVCGVHYPSDIEASKQLALALYAQMARQGEFLMQQAAARTEMRRF